MGLLGNLGKPNSPPRSDILCRALQAAQEWEQAQPIATNLQSSNATSSPIPDDPINIAADTVLCNTYGAWKAETLYARQGWVFLDSSSTEITRGAGSQSHVSSARMAEALAIREAPFHAISLGFNSIWLRSYAQALIKEISMKWGPIEFHGVLSDINSLSFFFSPLSFQFSL